MQKTKRPLYRKVLNVLLWIIGGVAGLVIILAILLQTNWAQQKIKSVAEQYLKNKLHTSLSIGSIRINWLFNLEIDAIQLEDKTRQQLLYVGNLKASYKLTDLLRNKLSIYSVTIDSLYANVYRPANDPGFNYDFILQAFSDTSTVTTSSEDSSSIALQLGTLDIQRIQLTYNDSLTGDYYALNGQSLSTRVNTIDLQQQQYELAYLESTKLAGVVRFRNMQESVNVTAKSSDTTSPSSPAPLIKINTIDLKETSFILDNEPDALHTKSYIRNLAIKNVLLDLEHSTAAIEQLVLSEHESSIAINKATPKQAPAIEKTTAAAGMNKPAADSAFLADSLAAFKFQIGSILVEQNNIRYDDNTIAALPNQLDANHLQVNNLNLDISELKYDGRSYTANIHTINATEKSGLKLLQLKGLLQYSDRGINWRSGELITNNNQLFADIQLSYDSIAQLTTHPNRVLLQASIKKTTIVIDDFLLLAPELKRNEYIQPLLGKKIFLQTAVSGTLDDFKVPEIVINQGASNLKANAIVKGMPDMDRLNIALNLINLSGTQQSLLSVLPEGLFPSNIHLPQKFALTGTINGGFENLTTHLQLQSSAGNITLRGNIKNSSQPATASYSLESTIDQVDIGSLMGDTTIGTAQLDIAVNGTGFELPTAQINFNGKINSLHALGYNYHGIQFEGNLKDALLKAAIQSTDSNLITAITVTYNTDSLNPELLANIDAKLIDFKALGFTNDNLTLKGNALADFSNINPDALAGNLQLNQFQIATDGRIYPLDSIKITADRTLDSQYISIQSAFLNASLQGKYELTALIDDATLLIERYRSNQPDTIQLPAIAQQASLNGTLSYPAFAGALVPGWTQMSPASIKGNMNSATGELNFSVRLKQIVYDDFNIDSLNVYVVGRKDSLLYYAGLNKLAHPSFPLFKTKVFGSIQHNEVNWTVETDDAQGDKNYRIRGAVFTEGNKTNLRLRPGIILNAENWNINEDNLVVLENGGLTGGNLQLYNNNQKIAVTTGATGVPVNVSFEQFPLTAIGGIIKKDTPIIAGVLNGNITISDLSPFLFTSSLKIDSVVGMGYPIGNLSAQVKSIEEGLFDINVLLEGSGNNVTVAGTYNSNNSDALAASIQLHPLNIASLEPFINSYVDSASGTLAGNLTVSGGLSAPVIRGKLETNKLGMIYKDYNTYFQLPQETFVIDQQGILLNNVVIIDKDGEEAILNGSIATTDFSDFKFNLTLKADNFLAINEQKNAEQWIYGPTRIDANLTIKGNMNMPEIDGDIKLRDNSKFNIIIRDEEPGIQDRSGIIRFVDKDNPPDTALVKKQLKEDSLGINTIKGVLLSVNLDITPNSEFTIILDENNGDHLQVKGTANLNATMDASGKTSMTGRYIVEDGSYQLSLNQLIKRNFKIQNGGSIIWNGDPTSATLDLTAAYNVNTSAYTLIKDVVSSDNAAAVKQKFPFNVLLHLKGEMLQPDISFELDMPEKDQNAFGGSVYTRLKQINNNPSELNKQVMGLLVLNNFIADNPFASLDNDFSSNLASTARQTAGKILSQQLNNLLGDVIKGVDVNFDVESKDDYNSGALETETNLKIGVSKNLFNDRTTVTVGSTVGLEGKNNTSTLAGDVAIEYKISRDGRYRLKLYRRNNDDVILEGMVVETGVSFIVFMDYNKFKEILQKSKEQKVIKRREKAEKQE